MLPADRLPIEESRVFTQADFETFARLSGDANPIHVDPAFAAQTPFGATVAHGMLLFSAIRGLIARHFQGCRLLRQELMFPTPTYAGETVMLRLERLPHATGGQLRLATTVRKADGSLGLQGECTLALMRAQQ